MIFLNLLQSKLVQISLCENCYEECLLLHYWIKGSIICTINRWMKLKDIHNIGFSYFFKSFCSCPSNIIHFEKKKDIKFRFWKNNFFNFDPVAAHGEFLNKRFPVGQSWKVMLTEITLNLILFEVKISL
jgi:hypothetical protein